MIILSDHWDCVRHMGTTPGATEREAIYDASRSEAVACVDYAGAAAEIGNAEEGQSFRCPLGSSYFLAASACPGATLLLDTGACDHLIGLKAVKHLREYIRKSNNPITLDVATGQLHVSDCIDLWISELALS